MQTFLVSQTKIGPHPDTCTLTDTAAVSGIVDMQKKVNRLVGYILVYVISYIAITNTSRTTSFIAL